MEHIFFIKNGDLKEVNSYLQKGGRVKSIHAVPETVSSYGYAAGKDIYAEDKGKYVGDVYAYIVVEFD